MFFARLGVSCCMSPRCVARPAVPISSKGFNASQGVVLHVCHEEGRKIVYVDPILVFWNIRARVVHRPHQNPPPMYSGD